MNDNKKIELIREYMKTGFKVDRIKDPNSNKFLRGIIFDSTTIRYVKDNARSVLREFIAIALKDIFPVNDRLIDLAMDGYLQDNARPKKNSPRRHLPKR